MRYAASLAVAVLILSACEISPRWFKSDQWYGDIPKEIDSKQPSYIPIAAVPPRPDIKSSVKNQKNVSSKTP